MTKQYFSTLLKRVGVSSLIGMAVVLLMVACPAPKPDDDDNGKDGKGGKEDGAPKLTLSNGAADGFKVTWEKFKVPGVKDDDVRYSVYYISDDKRVEANLSPKNGEEVVVSQGIHLLAKIVGRIAVSEGAEKALKFSLSGKSFKRRVYIAVVGSDKDTDNRVKVVSKMVTYDIAKAGSGKAPSIKLDTVRTKDGEVQITLTKTGGDSDDKNFGVKENGDNAVEADLRYWLYYVQAGGVKTVKKILKDVGKAEVKDAAKDADFTVLSANQAKGAIKLDPTDADLKYVLTGLKEKATYSFFVRIVHAEANKLSAKPKANEGVDFAKDTLVERIAATAVPVSVGFKGAVDKVYKGTDNIDVEVTFAKSVTVVTTGGIPKIIIKVADDDKDAMYASGSGSKVLTFRYQVEAGVNGKLSIEKNKLSLESGTIKYTSDTKNTPLKHAAVTSSQTVDTTVPTVTGVAFKGLPKDTTSKAYKTGEKIQVEVTFSEVVMVANDDGANNVNKPLILVKFFTGDSSAVYQSGSNSKILLFEATVGAGELDKNGIEIVVNKLALKGTGTIKDKAGNAATLAHTAVAQDGNRMVHAKEAAATVVPVIVLAPHGATSGAVKVTITSVATGAGDEGTKFGVKSDGDVVASANVKYWLYYSKTGASSDKAKIVTEVEKLQTVAIKTAAAAADVAAPSVDAGVIEFTTPAANDVFNITGLTPDTDYRFFLRQTHPEGGIDAAKSKSGTLGNDSVLQAAKKPRA